VSNNCLTPNEEYFSHIMARSIYIRWDDDDDDDDDVHFVLDKHTELDFYSTSSL
jgi:hypothetical protein